MTPLEILSLRPVRRRPGLVEITLSDATELRVSCDVAARYGLRATMILSADVLTAVAADQKQWECRESALRYLARSARTEQQLRAYLGRRGNAPDDVEQTIRSLALQGLVDDVQFVSTAAHDRSRRPRSRAFLEAELIERGVAESIVQNGLDRSLPETDLPDDPSSIQTAASQWVTRNPLRSEDAGPSSVRKHALRMAAFLCRRGFDEDLVRDTVEQHFPGVLD